MKSIERLRIERSIAELDELIERLNEMTEHPDVPISAKGKLKEAQDIIIEWDTREPLEPDETQVSHA